MSVLRPILMAWLKLSEKRFLANAQDIDAVRRGFARKTRMLFHAPKGTLRESASIAGCPVLTVTRKGTVGPRCILYFHGGAYVFGAPSTHAALMGQLCKDAEAKAILPEYRKAPEHTFPAAPDDAMAVWTALLQGGVDPHNIIIGGDSAGGGLALGLLHQLCVAKGPLPAGVFALSPLTDLTFSGDSITSNAESEAVLPAARVTEMADAYMGEHSREDPRASPLFGEFSDAPPVWLSVSDTELLRDDTFRMAERLTAKGVDVTLHQKRDLPHVWPLFHNTLPEARQTLAELGTWIKQQTTRSGES